MKANCPMIQNTSELWFIQLSYNNNNSPVYVDMVEDMAEMQNGVFTCTFRVDNGDISDYLVIENENYVNIKPPKTD